MGFTILDTNFRCAYGELGIVAWGEIQWCCWRYVTRSSNVQWLSEEPITFRKGQKLIVTAETYIQFSEDILYEWRIDLIAVGLDSWDPHYQH